jgi:hypothetical protein
LGTVHICGIFGVVHIGFGTTIQITKEIDMGIGLVELLSELNDLFFQVVN